MRLIASLVVLASVLVATITGCSDNGEESAPSTGGAGGSGGAAGAAGAGGAAGSGGVQPVSVRILAFSDFHGALDPSNTAAGPGAAYLAARITKERTPTTIVAAAGDLIGASPPVSGLLHDEPTIEVLNAIGLEYSAVGNHELDEGTAEFLRMQNGGCHPVDGCSVGPTFDGAKFQYLAANVHYVSGGNTFLPGYVIRDVDGAKVAFVGISNEETPSLTVAAGITDLAFDEEVAAVNSLIPEIKAAGAQNVVLLVHDGAAQSGSGGVNGCVGLSGSLKDKVASLDPAVRVVVGGHWHTVFNCTLGDRIVSESGANGSYLTEIDLSIDPATQTLLTAKATNLGVTHGIAPDPAIESQVAGYDALVEPLLDSVVGTISVDITRTSTAAGEMPLGDVVADAMLEATSSATTGNAVVALMNSGGLRADLSYAKSGPETADGQVRFGEAYAVEPFGNDISTVSLSGADLVQALDAWTAIGKPLQVAGMTYTWNAAAAPGSQITSVSIQGAPLVPTETYRVTVNPIIAQPETTPSMANATAVDLEGVDLDMLTAYFAAHPALSPPATDRISTQ